MNQRCTASVRRLLKWIEIGIKISKQIESNDMKLLQLAVMIDHKNVGVIFGKRVN